MGYRQNHPRKPEQAGERGYSNDKSRMHRPRQPFEPEPRSRVVPNSNFRKSPVNVSYGAESEPQQAHRREYQPRYKPAPEYEVPNPYGPKVAKVTNYAATRHHKPVEDNEVMVSQYSRDDMPYPRRPEEASSMSLQYGKNDLPNPRNQKLRRFEGRVGDVKQKFQQQGLVSRLKEWNDKRVAGPTPADIEKLRLKTEKSKYKYQNRYYQTQERGLAFGGRGYGGAVPRGVRGGRSGVSLLGNGRTFEFGNGMFGNPNSALGGRGGNLGGFGSGVFRSNGFGEGVGSLFSSSRSGFGQQPRRPVGRPRIYPREEPKSGLDKLFGF